MARRKINLANEKTQKEKTTAQSSDEESANNDATSDVLGNVGLAEPIHSDASPEKEKNPLESADELLNSLSSYSDDLPFSELPERKKVGRKKKAVSGDTEYPFVIPGRTFVVISDQVFCAAFGFIDKMTNKHPIDMSLMRLQEQQIKDLEELGAAAAKELFKGKNPLEVFLYSLALMQTTNYLTLRQLEAMKRKLNER